MFDLEQGVAGWRRQMLAAGIKTPVPLVELESHLREEVERQMRTGSSAQIAFETAVQRLGQATALKAEFEKTPAAEPLLRIGYLRTFCLAAAPLWLLVNIWALQPGEISPLERSWGLAMGLLAALYLGGLPWFYQRLPSPERRFIQLAMVIGNTLVLAWPLLATFISLGIVDLHLGIVAELTIWSVLAAWFATWLAYAVSGQRDALERLGPRRA